jgi:hypothetical protein
VDGPVVIVPGLVSVVAIVVYLIEYTSNW